MNIVAVLIPLGAFAMVFGIVYISVVTAHKSKMAMLEAGLDPRDADEREGRNPQKTLRNAILFIMVPIGILVGRAAASMFALEPQEGALIFAFLFGGLGFGIQYLIERRNELKGQG